MMFINQTQQTYSESKSVQYTLHITQETMNFLFSLCKMIFAGCIIFVGMKQIFYPMIFSIVNKIWKMISAKKIEIEDD